MSDEWFLDFGDFQVTEIPEPARISKAADKLLTLPPKYNLTNAKGQTRLLQAAQYASPNVLNKILDTYRKDIFLEDCDCDGNNAVVLAARAGRSDNLEVLLIEAFLSQMDNVGIVSRKSTAQFYKAFWYAVKFDRKECRKVLMQFKAIDVNTNDPKIQSPLIIAVKLQNEFAVLDVLQEMETLSKKPRVDQISVNCMRLAKSFARKSPTGKCIKIMLDEWCHYVFDCIALRTGKSNNLICMRKRILKRFRRLRKPSEFVKEILAESP